MALYHYNRHNTRNYNEDKLIDKIEVRKETDRLLKLYFRTNQDDFDIHAIANIIKNKFKSIKAYNIACDYYLEKIGL